MAELTCGVCHVLIDRSEVTHPCPSCGGAYHEACWESNGGCATTGCPCAPANAATSHVEATSYWGATEKVCPMCRETIQISATSCPHCRTVFGTTRPLTSEEMRARLVDAPEHNSLSRPALAIFICGLLGVTGPPTLLIGGIWYAIHRQRLRTRLPIYHLLAVVGLCCSAAYTLLIFATAF